MKAGNSEKLEKPGKEGAKPSPEQAVKRRKQLRTGLVVLVLVIGLIVWLATREGGGDNGSTTTTTTPAKPPTARIVTPAQLGELAKLGHPIYWAGAVSGTELELKTLPGGGAQIRYLRQGTEAGKGSTKALTIGTYPLPNPTASLQGYAKRPGAIVRHTRDGREIVTSAQRPTSVYFASPDNTVQVEVYAPSPRLAMSLALSGQVRPAG